MNDLADRLLRDHDAMAAERAVHEGRWRQIGELVWPAHADFSSPKSPQSPSSDLAYDSTARRASARFAALLVQVMTPRHERWHHLRPTGGLKQNHAAKIYLETIRDLLFELRYRPRSGFANAVFESFMQLGVFGTGVVYMPDRPGRGLTYQAVHLSECYIGTDASGSVDRFHRKYRLSARNAVLEFDGESLPEEVRKAAEDKPETMFDFLHCVEPRADVDPERLDARGMPIASYHLAMKGKNLLRESGYRSMPYLVFRYLGTPNNPWGISPGDLAFAETRMVNRMEKSQLNAANRAAEPIWLAADDNLPAPRLVPNAINAGWLDVNTGRELIKELSSNARLDIGEAKLEQKRQSIESAYLGDFFKTLIENPNMKATQVLELASARAEQVAPFISRLEEELFGPMIERELDIVSASGLVPNPPPEFAESADYKVEYDSPISRSLKSGEAVGIMRTVEGAMQIEALAPGARLVLDGNAMVRHLADAHGVPVHLLRSSEELQKLQAEAQQAEQAQQAMAAAPGLAKSVKDLAGVAQEAAG